MTTDDNRMTDEVHIEVNGQPHVSRPRRPAASALRSAWVDYAVALGADRGLLEGRTRHYGVVPHESGVGLAHGYATPPALTKDELIGLVDRLGG